MKRGMRLDDALIKSVCTIVAGAFVLLSSGCSQNAAQTTQSTQSSQSQQSSQSLYDRVMSQGKIRCAYVVYTPGCLKDPNTGKLTGIGIEAIEIIAKNLGLKVEWTEEVGWGSMVEGLQTNRYDMIGTPVWTNANRAKIADFSKPLFYSPILVYTKTGSKKVSAANLESVNAPDFKVATVDGETAEVIAREDFPKAQKVSLPQLTDLSQLLLTVSTGKADLTFAEPATAWAFIKNNPGAVSVVQNKPIRVFPNCWMFKRGQTEFKHMIDTVLDQLINSGQLEKIVKKYEPVPDTLYQVALPYRAPEGKR